MIDIKLPELGEGIDSVEISEVLIKPGDKVNKNDTIIIVETEKASMEIPTNDSGIINKLHIETGNKISPGDIIASIKSSIKTDTDNKIIVEKNIVKNKYSSEKKSDTEVSRILENNESIVTNHAELNSGKPVLASPSVRRFARELGCTLRDVVGSGPKNRITKEDIKKYIKLRLSESRTIIENIKTISPGQDTDFSKFGATEIVPLNKIKRITGTRLQKAWQAIPHVTQFDECDISNLDKLRMKWKNDNKDKNIKASFLPFFIKAICQLLIEMPNFNSSLDNTNQNLILKNYINVGIAVDTKEGLIVPVIKNANQKSILKLSMELVQLSQKARNKKLTPSEMEGGSITISSLGGIGGTYFTPIINPPEVAILGISKSKKGLYLSKGELKERLLLPISLSYDHRVIDGAQAALFTSKFGELLSNFNTID